MNESGNVLIQWPLPDWGTKEDSPLEYLFSKYFLAPTRAFGAFGIQ